MPTVIEFGRRGHHFARAGASSDFYVSQVDVSSKGSPGRSISVRFSKAVLQKLRWIVGDYVKASCEISDDGTSQTWTLTRVAGADCGGCKISGQGKTHGAATVRFTLPKEVCRKVFPKDDRGYTGELAEHDGAKASFVCTM